MALLFARRPTGNSPLTGLRGPFNSEGRGRVGASDGADIRLPNSANLPWRSPACSSPLPEQTHKHGPCEEPNLDPRLVLPPEFGFLVSFLGSFFVRFRRSCVGGVSFFRGKPNGGKYSIFFPLATHRKSPARPPSFHQNVDFIFPVGL